MERMERMERSQGPKIKVLNVNSCFYLFDFLIWAVLMNYEQRNDLQNDLGASYLTVETSYGDYRASCTTLVFNAVYGMAGSSISETEMVML